MTQEYDFLKQFPKAEIGPAEVCGQMVYFFPTCRLNHNKCRNGCAQRGNLGSDHDLTFIQPQVDSCRLCFTQIENSAILSTLAKIVPSLRRRR